MDTPLAWLAALTVIVIAGYLARFAASRISQTAVVGEIAIGILIAQAVAILAPGGKAFLELSLPALKTLADLGITLFMFGMGLHAHRWDLAGTSRARWTVPLGSFVLPFLVGAGVAAAVPDGHGASTPSFTVFIGTAFAATAFPVLARILEETGLRGSALGAAAVNAAAVCDILCWSIMAIVIAMSRPATDRRVWLAALYVAAMLLFVRPLLRRWLSRTEDTAHGVRLPAGLLASAFVSELVGLHVIIGAFLFGAVIPAGAAGEPVRRFVDGAAPLCTHLLLPTYFVLAGLRLDLTGPDGGDWLLFAVIVSAAVASKLLGTYGGSRLGGLPHRTSISLAVLMNTRGLTEIVILTVGLEAGIIGRPLYTVMVLMALVTTAMTTPLLCILNRRWERAPQRRLASATAGPRIAAKPPLDPEV